MYSFLSKLAALAVLAATGVHASLQIVPGGSWTASNGEHIQAHGAGAIAVNGTYYIVGEDKTGGSAFQNVNCYSSADLVRWRYEGALLTRQAGGDLGPGRVLERPKVIYNERTRKYVLWMHIDSSNYGEAKVGVATGDSVCGKYSYIRSFRPLGFESRDMGLFKDDDGTAYLLTEDRRNGLRINKLTDDYLDVAGSTSTYLWKESIESPAMIKLQGRYYMFGSHLTGWDANDNVYSTSTSLSSGWSAWANFADKGSKTYTSQTSYVLDYGGGNVMYMGDRWASKNLQSSTYVWLPLAISGASVSMKNYVSWVPNAGAGGGRFGGPPAENSYEGEAGRYAGAAKEVSCAGCSGKKAAGYVGGPGGGGGGGGRVTIGGIRSDADALTTVRVKYMSGDSGPRYADVGVNGGAGQRLAFVQNGNDPASGVLHAQLRAGGDNTIVISGVNGGWGPDVDRLMVPVQ